MHRVEGYRYGGDKFGLNESFGAGIGIDGGTI